MKHDLLTPMDDLTLAPSKELNETTLAKMQEGKQKTPATKRMPRRVLACAALVCAACMLMSMGYRVFSYLAYVPGAGIVSGELENTYTLVEAVKENGYYVEAMSLVPKEDGTWSVHVITNRPTYTSRGENPVPPLTLTDPEGNTATIPFSSGGSDNVTRYAGSIDHATPGTYTLRIEGTTYTVELASLTNSPFADYSYPTDNGITLICFPMSEGSDKLVFDVILEPESENMAFWQSHANSISASIVGNVTVTDVEGNTYVTHSQSSRTVSTPNDASDMLSYKLENVLTMDKRLSASVASIAVDKVELRFGTPIAVEELFDLPETALTVPAFGETVETDTVVWDIGGVQLHIHALSGFYDENNRTYAFGMDGTIDHHDFTENVTHVHIEPAYAAADTPEVRYAGGSSWSTYDNIVAYHKDIVGLGDKRIRNGSIDVDFGEEILVSPAALHLTLSGEWHIDFTK